MNVVFYVAAIVAIAATAMAISRLNAVHALLYLIVSLLSVALVFYTLGAPFIAALEVIIYAGAIMVLFVFVMMMLNLGPQTAEQEARWLSLEAWRGPAALATILIAELVYVLVVRSEPVAGSASVAPKQVGLALFGPYLLAVELASMLLLAGLVGAYHLGWRSDTEKDHMGGL
jgi:NADH-quinone oxidoreductase subunit J